MMAHKIVPVEPTDAMVDRAATSPHNKLLAKAVWGAMYDAAPPVSDEVVERLAGVLYDNQRPNHHMSWDRMKELGGETYEYTLEHWSNIVRAVIAALEQP